MTSDAEYIVLISSNYRREYRLDAQEVLCAPKGFVMHYRFQRRWISADLLQTLDEGTAAASLRTNRVLACFLQQSKNRNWERLIPTRLAELVHYEVNGATPDDPVDFYFQLGAHVSSDESQFDAIAQANGRIKGDGSDPRFAAVRTAAVEAAKNVEGAYAEFMRNWKLKDDTGQDELAVNALIVGLRDEDGNHVKPKRDNVSHLAYWELVDGETYAVEYYVYADPRVEARQFFLVTRSDERWFTNRPIAFNEVTSPYSRELHVLLPKANGQAARTVVRTELSFLHPLKESQEQSKPPSLCMDLDLHVRVVPHRGRLFRNLLGEAGLLVGTVLASLFAVLGASNMWLLGGAIGSGAVWLGLRLYDALKA